MLRRCGNTTLKLFKDVPHCTKHIELRIRSEQGTIDYSKLHWKVSHRTDRVYNYCFYEIKALIILATKPSPVSQYFIYIQKATTNNDLLWKNSNDLLIK